MTAPLAKQVAATMAAEHGCDVEDEDTGRLLTCRRCASQADVVLRVVAEWLWSAEVESAVIDVMANPAHFHTAADLEAYRATEAIEDASAVLQAIKDALTATGRATRPPGAPGTPAGVSQDVQDVRGAERGGER